MTMKTIISAAALAAMLPVQSFAADKALDNMLAIRAPEGSPVQLGVWNGDLDACKKVADEQGIPMIAIWSREGCAHCAILERALTSPVFQEWAKTCGMVLGFSCTRDPLGVRQGPENGNGKYYWFCKRPDMISDYPFVRFYWYKNGSKVVDYSVKGDVIDRQQGIGADGTYNKAGQIVIDYIMKTSGFGAYEPREISSYDGGNFDFTETDTDRLEAESGTGEISFELVRDAAAAESAASNTVKVVSPAGKTVQTVDVAWKAGETNKTVTVDASKMEFSAAGQKAALITVSAEGKEQATNHVTYVDAAISAANPLWIGERDASSLAAGEWTMDLDTALERTAAQEGDAYTLVMFTGALWCPWCRGIENYVLESEGFKNLVKEKNVALVCLDNPKRGAYDSFADGTADKTISAGPFGAAPTLLRAESGKAGNGTASGRGYVSRKGVTAEKAEEILQRNHDLGYAGGEYATPGAYRTGYPTFVLLDKKGEIAGRWKTISTGERDSESRYTYEAAANVEMLGDLIANASAERERNRYAAGTAAKLPIGQEGVAGFSANAPEQAFSLTNIPSGKVSFYVTANGASAAPVLSLKRLQTFNVSRLDASGKKVSETAATVASQYGESGEGSLVCEFTAEAAKGEYALVAAFTNGIAPGTAPFEVSIGSSPVLVPGEAKADFTPVSGQVSIEVEQDEVYKLTGDGWLDLPTSFSNVTNDIWKAKETYRAVMAVTPGKKISFQIWRPGTAGFTVERENTTEDHGTFQVEIGRSGGASGKVALKVSLDESETSYYDSDGKAKFEFTGTELVWDEGETGSKTVEIKLLDDERFDGDGVIALKLEYAEGSARDTAIETASYALTVTENDNRSPGRAMFAGAEPFFSKSRTVYVREGETAVVYADRIEATDGAASVKVTAGGGAELGGAATNNIVSWANHNGDPQAITVSGVAAGKTARVTMSSLTDGFKILSASNSVTVAGLAADAPAFESDTGEMRVYRNVACSNTFPVVLAEGAKLSFAKISGSLPAGLKAGADASSNALAIHGSPTAKPGKYTAVYQVSQQTGSKRTPGMTVRITFTVADPGVSSGDMVPVPNKSFEASASRVFKNLPVLDPVEKRLAGTVRLTIRSTGVISAKYVSAAGSASMYAKGWSGFDRETGALYAETTIAKGGCKMNLTCAADGSVTAILTDPAYETDLEIESDGNIWSKDNTASDWQGCYTVTLPFAGVVEEGTEGIAPRGSGFLTLKMDTTSAKNSGTVTWAGILPDGQPMSGTAVLLKGDCWAQLPIFKASSKDVFSSVLKIAENAIEHKAENKCQAVFEEDGVKSWWIHKEKDPALSYSVELDTYGGIYDPKENLADACDLYYETTEPVLSAEIQDLGGWLYSGTPAETVEGVSLAVSGAAGQAAIKIASGQANPQKFTFLLNRKTGVASGSFNLPYTDAAGAQKTLKANWKGVVLVGWGPGCGCGDGNETEVVLPFVNGAFWISESAKSGNTSVKVRRGGAIGAH